MNNIRKIEPQLLQRAQQGGTETSIDLPVFVEFKKGKTLSVSLLKNMKSYPELGLVYGLVQTVQIDSLADNRDTRYIWDAVAQIHLTPFMPLSNKDEQTDVRSIVFSPKGEKAKIDEKYLRGSGSVIGVIDTSADIKHPDLSPAVLTASDLTDDNDFNRGNKDHATHVAGIAIQVAPEARLRFYKVFSGNGGATRKSIVDAIMESVKDGCTVINGSWGEWGCQGECPVDRAVSYAVSKNVMFCNSAGNDGNGRGCTLSCPAGNLDIITVGACTCEGKMADFSSSGPSYKDGSVKPDVTAPGVEIASARPGGGYQAHSGTSMAAPVVSGCYAVRTSAIKHSGNTFPKEVAISPQTIKAAFIKSAKDLGADANHQGAGLASIAGTSNCLMEQYGLEQRSITYKALKYASAVLLAATIIFLLKNNIETEPIKKLFNNAIETAVHAASDSVDRTESIVDRVSNEQSITPVPLDRQKKKTELNLNKLMEHPDLLMQSHDYFEAALEMLEQTKALIRKEEG